MIVSCDSSRRVRGIPGGQEADGVNLLVQAGTVQRAAGSASNATQASDCEQLGCIIYTS